MASKSGQGSKKAAEERRARAAAMRAEQEKADRRRRNLLIGGTALVVIAIIVGVGIAIQSGRTTGGGGTPQNVTASNGIERGDSTAPAEITIYEDFQCPACQYFEATVGDTITELVDEGSAFVTYQPIAFLDNASTDRYSTRSLNAAACVVDEFPDSFLEFHSTLFRVQPAEGGPGLPDEQLISIAADAGADSDSVATCINDLTFEGWTADVTDAASQDGINSTPTVMVNGTVLEDRSPEGLRAAVEAASQG